MSNTTTEFAWHGSKLCMQLCVNNSRKKKQLDSLIGLGEVKWYSPLATENFKEYELPGFFKEHSEMFSPKINWPKLPKIKCHWDAIGVAPDGTLILVEAKAHQGELEKGCMAKDPRSISIIRERVYATMGGNDEAWMNTYYQIANRYVYLDQLNAAGIKTVLVYLYFVNDVTHGNESRESWDEYLAKMRLEHPTPQRLEPFVKHIFFDVWKEDKNPDLKQLKAK